MRGACIPDSTRFCKRRDVEQTFCGVCAVTQLGIVNRRGAEMALAIPLNDAEEAGLRASAEKIREAARKLGF